MPKYGLRMKYYNTQTMHLSREKNDVTQNWQFKFEEILDARIKLFS